MVDGGGEGSLSRRPGLVQGGGFMVRRRVYARNTEHTCWSEKGRNRFEASPAACRVLVLSWLGPPGRH